MTKLFSFTAKAALSVAVCLVAASLGGVAQAKDKDKAQITGYWNYNAGKSDDADRKVHEAEINNESGVDDARGGGANPTAGTADPGGGIGGGVGGGYPTIGGMGGGRMGGMGGGMGRPSRQGTRGPEVSSEEWDRLAVNPKYLQIDQHSDQLVVNTDADEPQTFYPDGKKHEEENRGRQENNDQKQLGRRKFCCRNEADAFAKAYGDVPP